jgi:hypothetical protein
MVKSWEVPGIWWWWQTHHDLADWKVCIAFIYIDESFPHFSSVGFPIRKKIKNNFFYKRVNMYLGTVITFSLSIFTVNIRSHEAPGEHMVHGPFHFIFQVCRSDHSVWFWWEVSQCWKLEMRSHASWPFWRYGFIAICKCVVCGFYLFMSGFLCHWEAAPCFFPQWLKPRM